MGETPGHEAEHHHPNYLAIWTVLVVLLVLGIAVGFVKSPVLGAVLVFGVATVKAFLVAANYMHLTFEPLFVRAIVLCGIAIVLIVLIGLIPDIVYVYGG
jgi:caa(3)-type oxidase subunit IV